MAVPVKVHKEYDELVDLLLSRGMDVPIANMLSRKSHK